MVLQDEKLLVFSGAASGSFIIILIRMFSFAYICRISFHHPQSLQSLLAVFSYDPDNLRISSYLKLVWPPNDADRFFKVEGGMYLPHAGIAGMAVSCSWGGEKDLKISHDLWPVCLFFGGKRHPTNPEHAILN